VACTGGIAINATDKPAPRLFPDRETDDLSTHAHRQLIGGVGMVLPVLLWLIAGWRTTEQPWVPLGSVSAYYYTGAVSAFAGMLVAMALFLFSYRGYNNKYYRRDRIAAIIAGAAAILIALFPTGAPSDSLEPSWWTPLTGTIHLLSGAALFSSFIFFSLFQFRMSSIEKGKPLPRDKQVRNVIYICCGVAMIVSMLWVIYALSNRASIFWPEVLALELFAVSWLVKGRVDATAVAAGRRSLYYGRNPRQLVKEVLTAVRGEQDAGPAASHNN
jgi:hypothetical protein